MALNGNDDWLCTHYQNVSARNLYPRVDVIKVPPALPNSLLDFNTDEIEFQTPQTMSLSARAT